MDRPISSIEGFIAEYMDKLGTRINILETELKYAWRALDMLSDEYVKMWERLERLETLLGEQQAVVGELMLSYTEQGDAARRMLEAPPGPGPGCSSAGAGPGEDFYRSLNVAYRSSYLGQIAESDAESSWEAERSGGDRSSDDYARISGTGGSFLETADIEELHQRGAMDRDTLDKFRELDSLTHKLAQDSTSLRQLRDSILSSPRSSPKKKKTGKHGDVRSREERPRGGHSRDADAELYGAVASGAGGGGSRSRPPSRVSTDGSLTDPEVAGYLGGGGRRHDRHAYSSAGDETVAEPRSPSPGRYVASASTSAAYGVPSRALHTVSPLSAHPAQLPGGKYQRRSPKVSPTFREEEVYRANRVAASPPRKSSNNGTVKSDSGFSSLSVTSDLSYSGLSPHGLYAADTKLEVRTSDPEPRQRTFSSSSPGSHRAAAVSSTCLTSDPLNGDRRDPHGPYEDRRSPGRSADRASTSSGVNNTTRRGPIASAPATDAASAFGRSVPDMRSLESAAEPVAAVYAPYHRSYSSPYERGAINAYATSDLSKNAPPRRMGGGIDSPADAARRQKTTADWSGAPLSAGPAAAPPPPPRDQLACEAQLLVGNSAQQSNPDVYLLGPGRSPPVAPHGSSSPTGYSGSGTARPVPVSGTDRCRSPAEVALMASGDTQRRSPARGPPSSSPLPGDDSRRSPASASVQSRAATSGADSAHLSTSNVGTEPGKSGREGSSGRSASTSPASAARQSASAPVMASSPSPASAPAPSSAPAPTPAPVGAVPTPTVAHSTDGGDAAGSRSADDKSMSTNNEKRRDDHAFMGEHSSNSSPPTAEESQSVAPCQYDDRRGEGHTGQRQVKQWQSEDNSEELSELTDYPPPLSAGLETGGGERRRDAPYYMSSITQSADTQPNTVVVSTGGYVSIPSHAADQKQRGVTENGPRAPGGASPGAPSGGAPGGPPGAAPGQRDGSKHRPSYDSLKRATQERRKNLRSAMSTVTRWLPDMPGKLRQRSNSMPDEFGPPDAPPASRSSKKKALIATMSGMLHKRRHGPNSSDSSADVSEASDFDDEASSGADPLRRNKKTVSEMHLLRMNDSFETEKLFPTVGASKKKNVTELVDLPNDIIFATVGTVKRATSTGDASCVDNSRPEVPEKVDSVTDSAAVSNVADPTSGDDNVFDSEPPPAEAASAAAAMAAAAEIPITSAGTNGTKTQPSPPTAAAETTDSGAVMSGSSREFAVSRALARYRQRQHSQSAEPASADSTTASTEETSGKIRGSPPTASETLAMGNGGNGGNGENGCVPKSPHDAPPESPAIDKVALQRLKEQFTALSKDYLHASNSVPR